VLHQQLQQLLHPLLPALALRCNKAELHGQQLQVLHGRCDC
jgi:hypothetical protein